jgi:hypothetical protein
MIGFETVHFHLWLCPTGMGIEDIPGRYLMKKKLFVIVVLVIGILVMTAGPAFAAISPEEKNQNIDGIIEQSGIQAQLSSIPAVLEQQIRKTKSPSEKSKRIAAIVAEDFTVESIVTEIKKTLSEQYNDKYAREVLKFYNSDLGIKVAQCEIASSDPAFTEKEQGFDIENYDQKRRQLINKLFNDMRTQDFYYLLFSSMYESILLSLNALLPEGLQLSTSKMNEFKTKIKEQYYSEEYKQKLLVDFYIMYEEITNDEVAEYSKFTRSKPGRWVNKCIETGMINGFKVCTEKMIKDIVEYSKNNPDDDQDDSEAEMDTSGENLDETF